MKWNYTSMSCMTLWREGKDLDESIWMMTWKTNIRLQRISLSIWAKSQCPSCNPNLIRTRSTKKGKGKTIKRVGGEKPIRSLTHFYWSSGITIFLAPPPPWKQIPPLRRTQESQQHQPHQRLHHIPHHPGLHLYHHRHWRFQPTNYNDLADPHHPTPSHHHYLLGSIINNIRRRRVSLRNHHQTQIHQFPLLPINKPKV